MITLKENLIQSLNESIDDEINLFKDIIDSSDPSDYSRDKQDYYVHGPKSKDGDCVQLINMFKKRRKQASYKDNFIYYPGAGPDKNDTITMIGYINDGGKRKCALTIDYSIYGISMHLTFRDELIKMKRKKAKDMSDARPLDSHEFEEFCSIILNH